MAAISEHFRNSFVAGNGMIDPWGTIRILDNDARPEQTSDGTLATRPGLPVWSAELVSFGRRGFRAVIKANRIGVINTGGKLITEIPFTKFKVADIDRAIVRQNGWLDIFIETPDPESEWRRLSKSLRQAQAGQRPEFLDNSSFVRVDRKLHRRRVILVSFGLDREQAKVFTQQGKEIPCSVSRPLAFKKWGVPEPEFDSDGLLDLDRDYDF